MFFRRLLAFFIVASYLPVTILVPFAQTINAQNAFGAQSLSNPEFYETFDVVDNFGIDPSELQAFRTETFETAISGFSLTFNNKTDLESFYLVATKANDSKTGLIKVEAIDVFKGEDLPGEASKVATELYTFSEGIKKVDFYSEKQPEFKISTYEMSNPSLNVAPESSESSLTKKLFEGMGLNLITRSEWGAPSTSPWLPTIVDVNRIVVHHTATSVNMSNPASSVYAMFQYHKNLCADNSGSYDPNNPNCDEQGELWEDIGYNYLIDPYGNIYEGRAGGNGVIGAHAPPNSGSIGIAVMGNYEFQDPTTASLNTLKTLITKLSLLNGFVVDMDETLFGHNQYVATTCPGRIANILPSMAVTAENSKVSEQSIKEVTDKVDELASSDREFTEEEGIIDVLVDTSGITTELKNELLDKDAGVVDKEEVDSKIVFKIEEDLLQQFLNEVNLIDPKTKAQPNFIYRPNWDNSDTHRSIPSDYDATTHWYYEKTKMPEAWKDLGGCTSDASCGGSNSVIVAVIDTGVAYEDYDYDAGGNYTDPAPDIDGFTIEIPLTDTPNGVIYDSGEGKFEGYERNFAKSQELSHIDSSRFIEPYDAMQDYLCELRASEANANYHCNTQELEKINHANDDDGHGTYVTTIIAGRADDANPNKVVGMAPNVNIMPIDVFTPNDNSFCFASNGTNDPTCSYPPGDLRVLSSTFVIANAIDHAVVNGADVINMSLGGSGIDPFLEAAINDATSNNVTIVASSGNTGNTTLQYPASYSGVISVGAVNSNESRSSYSSYGSTLDLVAPVGQSGQAKIVSQAYACSVDDTCSDETDENLFTTFSSQSSPFSMTGTSFAAPQVTAAVALLKSQKPSILNSEVESILFGTTKDLGVAGRDNETGYGMLNVDAALNSLWSNFSNDTSELFQSEVQMEVYDGKLYQAARGTNNKIYTRSFDGNSWSSFVITSEETISSVEMEVYDNKLYQAMVGTDTKIYWRYFNGVSWSSFTHNGGRTTGEVELKVYDNKLFMAVRGNDNKVYWKYFNGTTWTNFINNGGKTSGNVNMEVYDSKLFMAVQGTDTRVYTRYFDGVNWTAFVHNGGKTSGDVDLAVFDDKLFEAVRGTDDKFYWRTYDGADWTAFVNNNGRTLSDVSMVVYDSRLYFSVVGTDKRIYSRYFDGNEWTRFIHGGGGVGDHIYTNQQVYDGELYQELIGRNNKIYTRNLIN